MLTCKVIFIFALQGKKVKNNPKRFLGFFWRAKAGLLPDPEKIRQTFI